jgi:hypothetical protein
LILILSQYRFISMDNEIKNAQKLEVAERLLDTGASILVYVNGSKIDPNGIPPHLRGKEYIVFEFGRNLPNPVTGLSLDYKKICGTLSFKGEKFFCTVAWESVFAIINKANFGHVWEDDSPPSMVATCRTAKKYAKTPAWTGEPRAYIKANASTVSVPVSFGTSTSKPKTKVKLPPYLRVVK